MPFFYRCQTCNIKLNSKDEIREHYYDEEKNILEGNEVSSHTAFEKIFPIEYDPADNKLIEK